MSPVFVLAVSVLAVSSAAVLVRLVPQVDPIVVAFWRTGMVAALLSPAFLRRPSTRLGRRIAPRDLALTATAGLLLALHFWLWFTSLHMTTVLRSTLLVCLNPVWAGLLEWLLWKTAPAGRFWAGVGLALLGIGAMGGAPAGGSGAGDLLATLGGVAGAAYLVLGRSVRQRVGIGRYGALVSGAAAAWLWPVTLLVGADMLHFDVHTWLVLGALAVGPQLLGHIGLNYVVRNIPVTIVTAALLLEPVGATALGAVVLDEVPGWRQVAGGAVVLVGVLIATFRVRSVSPEPMESRRGSSEKPGVVGATSDAIRHQPVAGISPPPAEDDRTAPIAQEPAD